jgi:hypothetical protein
MPTGIARERMDLSLAELGVLGRAARADDAAMTEATIAIASLKVRFSPPEIPPPPV